MFLCLQCHSSSERASNPRFIFFIDDIQYFIRYETSDFEYRKAIMDKSDSLPRRHVPTAAEYRSYQERKGVKMPASSGTRGGLYRRNLLRPTKASEPSIKIIDVELYPVKAWTGCPMATFAKTFARLGPWSHKYPKNVREELRQLQDLYGDNDRTLLNMDSTKPEPETSPGLLEIAGPAISSPNRDGEIDEAEDSADQYGHDSASENQTSHVEQLSSKRKREESPDSSTVGRGQATTEDRQETRRAKHFV